MSQETEQIKPELEFVFMAEASLGKPELIGETFEGQRRIIEILDGKFTGPNIRGSFVKLGGADWQYTRNDGVTQAEATYAIKTDDEVIIQVENFGLRHGPKEVMQRLASGDPVTPGEYYFRTSPRFKAPNGKYDWLNKSIFVATGARFDKSIKLWFYRVA